MKQAKDEKIKEYVAILQKPVDKLTDTEINKGYELAKDKDIQSVFEKAARQSALAEIEQLKKEIENSRKYEKDLELGHGRLFKENKELKKQLSEKDKMIFEEIEIKTKYMLRCKSLEEHIDRLLKELSQFREGVGKLKHELPRMGLTDDDFVKIINKVNEIFPDCAPKAEKKKR